MYLVTGATGNVGSNVVDQLLAEGEPVRVFTRDKAKVAHWGDRVQVALGDFTKPETYAEAVSGVDGITEAAVENMVRSGIPAPIATGVAKSFETIRDGKAAMATDAVEQLTGRPPLTFEDWATRHVDKFA